MRATDVAVCSARAADGAEGTGFNPVGRSNPLCANRTGAGRKSLDGNRTDVHWLLIDLCEKSGYSMAVRNPESFVPLVAKGPELFADAVLVAEGLDPQTMDKHQRRGVVRIVAERFELWAERERASRGTDPTVDEDE
jgi:hypothetical protein